MEAPCVTADDFKAAMGSFAAGVTVVTTISPCGAPEALTATAFSSVSVSPPLCLVCIHKRARSHGPLLQMGSFAINILGAHQESLSKHFAAPIVDRFEGVSWQPGEVTRCPLIVGALASMECQLAEVHAGGDHDILLGRVTSVRLGEGVPLVYWRGRYSSLLAGTKLGRAESPQVA